MIANHKRAVDRIGLSDSQANANAGRKRPDRPFIEQSWRSFDKRRRNDPPRNVDALVSWFREQYELEIPAGTFYNSRQTWADHQRPGTQRRCTHGEQCIACKTEPGGSAIGSPSEDGQWASYQSAMDLPHHKDEEGDLLHPMRSAMAAFRGERPRSHDAITALTYHGFEWRKLIDKPFYKRQTIHDQDGKETTIPVLVMAMPEDVLEAVLVSGLTRLWWLLAEREPHVREVA